MTSKKQSKKKSKKSKREDRSSVFDAIQILEQQDKQQTLPGKQHSKKSLQTSQAALSQTKIYHSLVECRILLQRALQQASATVTSTNNITQATDACQQLLVHLLQARKTMVQGQRKHAKYQRQRSEEDPFDHDEDSYAELLRKDRDMDTASDQHDSSSSSSNQNQRDLAQVLQDEYDSCRHDWQEVLNRRHKEVRLHAGLLTAKKSQFRTLDATFWQQVEQTTQHEELQDNRRRQAKRQRQEDDMDEGVPDDGNDKDADNPFEFDDTKVYQHMLKDFLAFSGTTASTGDAALASRQRLEKIQDKKNKTKPTVDRKASKGRKIRYNEIPKLVRTISSSRWRYRRVYYRRLQSLLFSIPHLVFSFSSTCRSILHSLLVGQVPCHRWTKTNGFEVSLEVWVSRR